MADEKKLSIKKANDSLNLRSFKEPKTNIYDDKLAEKELKEFLSKNKEQEDKSRE